MAELQVLSVSGAFDFYYALASRFTFRLALPLGVPLALSVGSSFPRQFIFMCGLAILMLGSTSLTTSLAVFIAGTILPESTTWSHVSWTTSHCQPIVTSQLKPLLHSQVFHSAFRCLVHSHMLHSSCCRAFKSVAPHLRVCYMFDTSLCYTSKLSLHIQAFAIHI